ncbi:PA2779 family protein [Elongatibacter sediminis]|uniref:PA2779 family protein n=1 Tax=Elongatibacter sediminis TaxID=3119006 RepID=A0AAW9RNP5_9GAMM
MYSRIFITLLSGILVFATLTPPASAAVVSTQDVLSVENREARIASIQSSLAREDVRAALIRHGVQPGHAQARVASLTDEELAELEGQIESLPAGGGALALVGAVFVVLLILELTGVVNIFHSP